MDLIDSDAQRLEYHAHNVPEFTKMQVELPETRGAGNMNCGI